MSQSPAKPVVRSGLGEAELRREAISAGLHRRIDALHSNEATDLTETCDSRLAEIEALVERLPQDTSAPRPVELSPSDIEIRAKELGDQLTLRRRDLDLREARLNRQLMLLDQERQAARLAIAEQEQALQTRVDAVTRREKEAADQSRRAALAEEALRQEVNCARENLDSERRAIAQESQLHPREQMRLRAQSGSLEAAQRRFQQEREALQKQLDEERAALQLERKQFEHNTRAVLVAIEEKQAALDKAASKLSSDRKAQHDADRLATEQNRKSLKRAEAEYLRLTADLELQLKDIAKQRAAHDEDCRNERRRLLLEREAMQQELNRQRDEFQRRQASMEDAQAALQKTQTELADQQRAILEERLAVEQVMQALGRQHASQNGQALLVARQKLAEHYRWMKESLQTQKSELLEIAKQLEAREHLLEEDRHGLQQWVENQQTELDTQLVQIEAQRQQLQRREAEISERELRWAMQKKGLEARLAIAQARAA